MTGLPCLAQLPAITDQEVNTYNAEHGTHLQAGEVRAFFRDHEGAQKKSRVTAGRKIAKSKGPPAQLSEGGAGTISAKVSPDQVKYSKRARRLLHSGLHRDVITKTLTKEGEKITMPAGASKLEEALDNANVDPRLKVLARRLQGDLELNKKIQREEDLAKEKGGSGTFSYDKTVRWIENNFTIQESMEAVKGMADKSPALFSWSKSKGEKGIYTVDAAVDFHPDAFRHDWIPPEKGPWDFDSQARILFEAHTSTEVAASTNSIYYAVPIVTQLDWKPPANGPGYKQAAALVPFVSRWHLAVTPEYITDRAKSVQVGAVDISLTPTIRKLHLNLEDAYGPADAFGIEEAPTFGISPHVFAWGFQGTAGFKYAHYGEGAEVLDPKVPPGSVVDYYGSAELAAGLGITLFERLKLHATYNAACELFGNLREHQYREYNAILPFDSKAHLSLILSYKRGTLEPDFVHVNQVTASLGVQF